MARAGQPRVPPWCARRATSAWWSKPPPPLKPSTRGSSRASSLPLRWKRPRRRAPRWPPARYPPRASAGVSGPQPRSNRFGTVPDYLKIIDDNYCRSWCEIERPADWQGGGCDRTAVDGRRRDLRGAAGSLAAALGTWATRRIRTVAGADEAHLRARRRRREIRGTLAPRRGRRRGRYMEWGATFRWPSGSDLGPLPAARPGPSRQVSLLAPTPARGGLDLSTDFTVRVPGGTLLRLGTPVMTPVKVWTDGSRLDVFVFFGFWPSRQVRARIKKLVGVDSGLALFSPVVAPFGDGE